jgi:hypothetical protein
MVSGRADPPWSAEFGLEGETIDGMGLIREFSFAGQDHSRRWRQVGGPRRVSPTVLRAPRHIRQSRSYHRREQSFAHSGVRSAERRPWSLPFAPLSPVPPEVEPYLPFFCSKSSSYFRVRSRVSRFHFFLTPMATSGRTAAGQPYQFLSDVINQISEFMPPRGH